MSTATATSAAATSANAGRAEPAGHSLSSLPDEIWQRVFEFGPVKMRYGRDKSLELLRSPPNTLLPH